MFCPQCGAENAATNRFCIKCGAPLSAATSPTAAAAPGAVPATPPPGPPTLPPAAAPPSAVTAPHFARTGTVLVVAGVAAVIIFLIVLAVGAVFVLGAASHRGSTAGGIRPAPSGAPRAPEPGPTVPPPAAPPSGGSGAAPHVSMQRYHAPSGIWTIDAPSTWHLLEGPNGGFVVFYDDDADEGTAFAVIPFQSIQAEVGTRDVLAATMRSLQQHAPDLQVRINNVRDISSGDVRAEALDGDAAWTGGRGQAMLGHVNLITFSKPGSGTTTFLYFGGQSPAQVFPAVRPVFEAMLNSFRASHP